MRKLLKGLFLSVLAEIYFGLVIYVLAWLGVHAWRGIEGIVR